MRLFERRADEWVLIGRELAVGPTDVDPQTRTCRLVANGRRLGGPDDGQPFRQDFELSKGDAAEVSPMVVVTLIDVVGEAARLGVFAPPHLDVMTREQAEGRRP